MNVSSMREELRRDAFLMGINWLIKKKYTIGYQVEIPELYACLLSDADIVELAGFSSQTGFFHCVIMKSVSELCFIRDMGML